MYETLPTEPPKVMNYPYVDGQRVVGGMSKVIEGLGSREEGRSPLFYFRNQTAHTTTRKLYAKAIKIAK